jgi:hypothetical protein
LRVGSVACVASGLLLLSACGSSAAPTASPCPGNVAVVDGSGVSTLEYRALLSYTLGFYERSNPASRYYYRRICGVPSLAAQCAVLKRRLLRRLIDQSLINRYAASHNLLATPRDWNKAFAREHKLIVAAGGRQAFLGYLEKLGTDEAQFQLVEYDQIETGKVLKAMGRKKFKSWLAQADQGSSIIRCPLPS